MIDKCGHGIDGRFDLKLPKELAAWLVSFLYSFVDWSDRIARGLPNLLAIMDAIHRPDEMPYVSKVVNIRQYYEDAKAAAAKVSFNTQVDEVSQYAELIKGTADANTLAMTQEIAEICK